MNKNNPKRERRETMETGIGRFTTKKNRALLVLEAAALIEKHVIYPELYQDIRNAVNAVIEKNQRGRGMFRDLSNDYYSIQFKLAPNHRVLELRIAGHQKYKFTSGAFSYHLDVIYLRVTHDGLIADFYDYKDLPKYNPGAMKILIDRDEKEYH